LNRSPLVRALLASVALSAAVALAGCDTDNANPSLSAKAMQPISQKTLSEMAQKNMSKESPILVRLFKQESELEVWKQDNSGRFALLHTFPICRWSGDLGPKIKEGDRQAPEGFYNITRAHLNPNSQYHLAFNMGFPNAYDKANDRTGAFLMIHGDCSSRGCYAMTDEQIAEIYALARESFFGGQRSFQIQAFPFRMTPLNMAKHRGNPHMAFWRMLKEGYDHFEVTRQEPKVDVCDKRYVFNASQPEGSFSPRAQCPVFEVPEEIASAVAEKKKKDDTAVADLIRRGTPAAPIKMATDGGMHQVFAEALQGREVRGKDGEIELVKGTAPGTIPPTVNPPSNVRLASTPAPTPAAAPKPSTPASRSIVARAPAQPAAKPAQAAPSAQPTQTAAMDPIEKTRNFLSGLFSSNGSQAQTASVAPASPTAAASPASRGSSAAAVRPGAQPSPAPAAKPKPAPTTAVAEAKPAPEPQEAETSRMPNAGAIRPQSPVSAFNGAPAGNLGLLSGAAPVVPAGSFGTNWSGLR
jgi:murein L,D-transpeptidase YafK